MNSTVTAVLILLFVLVLVATVLIIILGDRETVYITVPSPIDVVLVDRGRNRVTHQVSNIDRYMPWVQNIVVVKMVDSLIYPTTTNEENETEGAQHTIINVESNATTLQAVFESITDVEHFIFFGDTTFPTKTIDVRQFWSQSRKLRLFNYLQVDTNELDQYYETTMPVMIVDTDDLTAAGTLDYYVLSLALTDRVVYSPSLNHVVILTNNEYTDDQQLDSHQPDESEYFTTFLIPPTLPLSIKQTLNQKILDYVSV